MSWCIYNFVKFPMCIYNFNVAFRISINQHQKYLEWNGDRFRRCADSIGINTSKVVDAILPLVGLNNSPTEAVWNC